MLTAKCTMADKSTKTDDALLNGELEPVACPTTTNAATMTTVVATEAPPRLTQVSLTAVAANVKAHVTLSSIGGRRELSLPKQPPSPTLPVSFRYVSKIKRKTEIL